MPDFDTPAPRRAIGYIRVSTEEQARAGHSLGMQPERIAHWCAATGDLQLVDVIRDEGVSAGKPLHKRPGGAELLRRLAAGEADVVVVYRLDRIFRNTQQGLNFIRGELQDLGVALQSVTERIDTGTADGKLWLTIQLAIAEYERDRTSERTRAVSTSLRQRGRKYAHAPFGTVATGGHHDEAKGRVVGQSLARDPQTWPVRERIVAMRLDGKLSLRAIAARLAAERIDAPGGGAEWSISTLNELVKSHASLAHLPLHAPQDAAPAAAAPETAPSADAVAA